MPSPPAAAAYLSILQNKDRKRPIKVVFLNEPPRSKLTRNCQDQLPCGKPQGMTDGMALGK